MRLRLAALLLVLAFTLLAVAPGTAAPLAGPCAAGAAYDPACDVNHDGVINVLDVQLAAGHWNRSGVYTSDNDHDHLGQTWTGNGGSGLKLEGSFGAPDYAPLVLSNNHASGGIGLIVTSAPTVGVRVTSVGTPSGAGFSTFKDGLQVSAAEGNGVFVGWADAAGVRVLSASQHGVDVYQAGLHGVSVAQPGWDGLFVESAGDDGVHVANANDEGMYVGSAGGDGFYVHSAFYSGLVVNDAGNDGVFVREATNWAGRFIGNISVSGVCSGCLQANFAVNAGERALQPGDAVSVQAVAAAGFDANQVLWQVTPAQPGQAAAGVVAGRAELVTEPLDEEEGDPPTAPSQHLAPREGATQPGEYLMVVYSGPMQVRVASNESAIAAGERVTAGADGAVRPLATRTVDGMVVSEGAPALGIALEPAKDGLVWVLVNPQ
jgi:hypothetical protein